jgi:hypothetical protein
MMPEIKFFLVNFWEVSLTLEHKRPTDNTLNKLHDLNKDTKGNDVMYIARFIAKEVRRINSAQYIEFFIGM